MLDDVHAGLPQSSFLFIAGRGASTATRSRLGRAGRPWTRRERPANTRAESAGRRAPSRRGMSIADEWTKSWGSSKISRTSSEVSLTLSPGDRGGPPPGRGVAGAARGDEPQPAVAAPRPKRRGLRDAGGSLRLVQRGVRHRRSERGQSAVGGPGVSRPEPPHIYLVGCGREEGCRGVLRRRVAGHGWPHGLSPPGTPGTPAPDWRRATGWSMIAADLTG